ncbi:MAG: hypothetical protein ABIC04_07250 [Nanoarchaeota archaeon]
MRQLRSIIKGLNKEESEKFDRCLAKIKGNLDHTDPDFSDLKKETIMGVYRDIQAQRLSPNVKVPSRKKPISYLKTIYGETGSLMLAIRSYLSSGSWTSSGGSFKLAEHLGYDILDIVNDIHKKKGRVGYLEVGAGYAGFRSDSPIGIKKITDSFSSDLGKTVDIYFTNLTNWHDSLPEGVKEFSGLAARDIDKLLEEGIRKVDVIHSQYGAYFEKKIDQFFSAAGKLLNQGGYLIFNAPIDQGGLILKESARNGFCLEKSLDFNGETSTLYAFRKN